METFLVFKVSCISLQSENRWMKMKKIILEKALDLFVKRGFKMVTMDEIAKELGISKKTIYTHFASKDLLVEETANFLMDEVTERLRNISGTCETPVHEHFIIKNCMGELFGHNIQPSTIYQFNKYYPKIAEQINKKRQKDFAFIIKRNLKDGVKKGYYRKDIDLDFVRIMFFISSTYLFQQESLFENKTEEEFQHLKIKTLDYHLRSIVTPKGLEILEQLLKTHYTNEI